MAITIAQIKELRDATAAGMGACKEALTATNGDLQEAIKFLREKGLAVAAKRVDKESKQGIIALAKAADNKAMALAEVNCETDFVANTDAYKKFCADAAQVALEGKDIEQTLNDDYKMLLTKTGENVKIRRSE
ncbi:MAG: translation elongation factor Ts, partial [Kiritimatiellae bacterium]|nr:translation elongation factor Ts [Kiritimatiellia bacterium]